MLRALLHNLTEPRSRDEDLRRQEFIMNVLLLGSVLLSLFATIDVVGKYASLSPEERTHLASPAILITVLAFFSSLYGLSRAGYYRLAAYCFLAIYYIVGCYTLYHWGINSIQAWLVLALVIVTSGTVLSIQSSFMVTGIISASIIYLGRLELTGANQPVPSTPPTTGEIIVGIVTLSIMTLVSWLSNRDIQMALRRARTSEQALKEERDSLELRVAQRTQELHESQQDTVSRLYRFAQFGRLTSGVLHDILNPLTAVALNLEELSQKDRSGLLREAIENTKRMEHFIEATRKEIQDQHDKMSFSVEKEIRESADILRYRANKVHARIEIEIEKDIVLHNSPIKFHQIISNLLSNAVDACGALPPERHDRLVTVRLRHPHKNILELSVTDNGTGISGKNLEHIFEPLFTTKDIDHGTGLGLSVCREIVEQEFKGTITVESSEGVGSTFVVSMPIE